MQTYDLEVIELLGQTGNVLLVSESYGGENHFTALSRQCLSGRYISTDSDTVWGRHTQFPLGNDLRFMYWFVTRRPT
jgi:hypothetical protein